MRELRIDVTQKDIDCGERGRCSFCPIASALRRALDLEHVRAVSVYPNRAYVWDGSSLQHSIELPQKATAFINRFDAGNGADPISFTVKIP